MAVRTTPKFKSMNVTDIIGTAAKVPSFSSFEERLHPFITEIAASIETCKCETVHGRNLVLTVPGKRPGCIALSAHLDKINHFGESYPSELPFEQTDTKLIGQLDNTAGIGIVMALLQMAPSQNWPTLMVLLSEMEESTGLKKHPNLLRNGGKGLNSGLGAERLSNWMLEKNIIPDAVITVDTTPLFKGDSGCALYSKHWEFTKTSPSEEEIQLTEKLVGQFKEIDPDLLQANNTNDYLTYGKVLNQNAQKAVPSVAIEPAIFPYHTLNEEVYIADIHRIMNTLQTFLNRWKPEGASPIE